jgi:hypothetical protein
LSEWSEHEFGVCECGVPAGGPQGYCLRCFWEKYEEPFGYSQEESVAMSEVAMRGNDLC